MKKCLKTLSTVVALSWGVFSSPCVQATGAVEQLHLFLQSTRTLRAEFTQTVVAKGGRKPQQSTGIVTIARPGKLRWEILKPYPQLIVGDGQKIWIHDPELQQVTVRKAGQALGSSPAALLAGNNELEKNFVLSDAGERDGLRWVEAVPKLADSGFEKIRIGFAGDELRGMLLFDSFGQTTQIGFAKMERNPSLPVATFRFVPPAGADIVGE